MKCIYITNILNEELLSEQNVTTVSYADNLAQLEIAQRLFEVYKSDLIVISAAYNDYQKLNHKEETMYARNIPIIGVKNCSRNKIVYYLTIIRGYYKKLKYYLKKYKDEKIIVITNGPHIFRTLPIYLTKHKYQYKFIPFLLGGVELPEYTGIYKFISGFSKKALKLADGSIAYVSSNSKDYTNKPYVKILYSVSTEDRELSNIYYGKKDLNDNKKTVLYAGALNDINSCKTLVEVIKKSPSNIYFWVCGDGIYKDELEELQRCMPKKINFFGKISHQKVVELEHKADYLIILRDTTTEIGKYHAKYSTSSKLLEYLLSGTPIIVNNHGAIPDELKQYLNLIKNESPNEVLKFLSDNSKETLKKQLDKANKGREYVLHEANYRIQGDKVIAFLNSL